MFWFCCNEESDDSKAPVAFFCFGFVAAKKGDGNKVVVTFYFCFVTIKKAMTTLLSSPSCVLVLLQ
jgi:hypothetical protein